MNIRVYGSSLQIPEDPFISHDEDIDIAMPITDLEHFKNILFVLRENDFEVARFEKRGFMSIMRNGEYIDISFFTPYPEDNRLSTCICDICEVKYINNTNGISKRNVYNT